MRISDWSSDVCSSDLIGNALAATAARCGTARPLVQRNADAGRQALEWANHQFLAVEEIKPGPIDVGQGVINQRRQIGGIGDAIALTVHQRPRLREQLRILLGFAAADGPAGAQGISLRAQCSSASTISDPFNGHTYVTSLLFTHPQT